MTIETDRNLTCSCGFVVDGMGRIAAAGAIGGEVSLVDRAHIEASSLSEVVNLPRKTMSHQRLTDKKMWIPLGAILARRNLTKSTGAIEVRHIWETLTSIIVHIPLMTRLAFCNTLLSGEIIELVHCTETYH